MENKSEQKDITNPVSNSNTNSNSKSDIDSSNQQDDKDKQSENEMRNLINDIFKSDNETMTSSHQIKRLLNGTFINPFETLMLTPDASEEEIKKQYRTISLLVHPDKNQQDPSASDAFHGNILLTYST
jgi:hypothetical protein